jgi:hypothetical protein
VLAGLAVGHHGDIADGKDARTIFDLKICPDGNAPAMTSSKPREWTTALACSPAAQISVCVFTLSPVVSSMLAGPTFRTPVPVCTFTPRSSSALRA